MWRTFRIACLTYLKNPDADAVIGTRSMNAEKTTTSFSMVQEA